MSGKISGCIVEGETQDHILARLNSDVADQRLKVIFIAVCLCTCVFVMYKVTVFKISIDPNS